MILKVDWNSSRPDLEPTRETRLNGSRTFRCLKRAASGSFEASPGRPGVRRGRRHPATRKGPKILDADDTGGCYLAGRTRLLIFQFMESFKTGTPMATPPTLGHMRISSTR